MRCREVRWMKSENASGPKCAHTGRERKEREMEWCSEGVMMLLSSLVAVCDPLVIWFTLALPPLTLGWLMQRGHTQARSGSLHPFSPFLAEWKLTVFHCQHSLMHCTAFSKGNKTRGDCCSNPKVYTGMTPQFHEPIHVFFPQTLPQNAPTITQSMSLSHSFFKFVFALFSEQSNKFRLLRCFWAFLLEQWSYDFSHKHDLRRERSWTELLVWKLLLLTGLHMAQRWSEQDCCFISCWPGLYNSL